MKIFHIVLINSSFFVSFPRLRLHTTALAGFARRGYNCAEKSIREAHRMSFAARCAVVGAAQSIDLGVNYYP